MKTKWTVYVLEGLHQNGEPKWKPVVVEADRACFNSGWATFYDFHSNGAEQLVRAFPTERVADVHLVREGH